MANNTLYISFDGLSDPLGRSQIIPYLTGISAHNIQITVLTCEKKDKIIKESESIQRTLGKSGIKWDHVLYDEDGGFLSRYHYLKELTAKAEKLHETVNFKLIHCRSYLAALIGLHFKRKYNIPFIFDMRGLWADERIDGKIWNKKNPIHLLAYLYFKKKEKEFFRECDALISLTENGSQYLSKQFPTFNIPGKTTVIPCCTDTEHFSRKNVIPPDLGFTHDDHVLIYSGSIGTWYNTNEMLDCVSVWKKFIPNLKLLIVTKDLNELQNILSQRSDAERAIVKSISVNYSDMPAYLSLAKASIFFIKPVHSKIASSPTKMAECWSMGIPVITNKGIGDNDLFVYGKSGGILVNDFNESSYEEACRSYLKFTGTSEELRKIATQYFDNKEASVKYANIYQSLLVR